MRFNIDKATRDSIMFLGGLAGVVYEAVVEHVDRPYLLAIFGGMMGLPFFIRKDERSSSDKHSDEEPESR